MSDEPIYELELRSDSPAAAQVRRALTTMQTRGARVLRVVAPDLEHLRADADAVARAIAATPPARLLLVSSHAAVGFFASSLSLRLPRVEVRAERQVADRRSIAPASPAVSAAPTLAAALGELERAARDPRASALVVPLPPGERPDRAFIDELGGILSAQRHVTRVALVHPSSALGFLASSLALRCPWCRIASFTDPDAAHGWAHA
ncbi:MAG: hypothetical protein KF729_17970 [Sandaracinaceae bacterium]|nr:hypothetical protein [Sandaracinaceae bacterium]